jgi:hypothetical protein
MLSPSDSATQPVVLAVTRDRDERSLDPPPGLRLRTDLCGGAAVLRVSGRLGVAGISAVEVLLGRLLAAATSGVTCDLGELDYLSPRALRRLLALVTQRPAHPPPLVLCAASGQPARVIALMDPDHTIPVFETVPEALAVTPEPYHRAELALTGDVEAPARARAFASGVCIVWGLQAVLDDVVLVVSELVTNAFLHAGGAGQVTLERCGALLTIAIADPSGEWSAERAGRLGDEGGRGLSIVRALTGSAGSYPQPDGKVVWCSLPLPASG